MKRWHDFIPMWMKYFFSRNMTTQFLVLKFIIPVLSAGRHEHANWMIHRISNGFLCCRHILLLFLKIFFFCWTNCWKIVLEDRSYCFQLLRSNLNGNTVIWFPIPKIPSYRIKIIFLQTNSIIYSLDSSQPFS